MANDRGFSNEPKLPGVKEPKSPKSARGTTKVVGSARSGQASAPNVTPTPARASAIQWESDVSPARAVTPLPPDANVPRPPAASESSLDWLAHVPLFALIAGLPFFAMVYGIRTVTAARRGEPANKVGGILALVAGGAVILGVIGVVAAIVLDPTGSRYPTELDVGDCVLDTGLADGSSEPVTSVEVVDCEVPHYGQVYYVSDLAGGTYPGASALSSRVDKTCRAEGDRVLFRATDAEGYSQFLYPTRELWYQGDRSFRCLVVTDSEIGYSRSLLVP